ncbi:hypothetical protein [Paenibacillus sp. FSL R7-0128]|uniref:hypothetical protein n=1 Tax=Paenibacillus sp. FSL R7-0128 TaxID=2954529 RepID=UPI0030F856F9
MENERKFVVPPFAGEYQDIKEAAEAAEFSDVSIKKKLEDGSVVDINNADALPLLEEW